VAFKLASAGPVPTPITIYSGDAYRLCDIARASTEPTKDEKWLTGLKREK
jgi:hypothetical protein